MKLTLELVRQTLRETLGHDSFVAGFITSVEADSGCSTAGITKEGQLFYNPSFIDEFVKTKEDLFSLIFHELTHGTIYSKNHTQFNEETAMFVGS